MTYIATAVLLLASLGQVLAQTRVDWKMQVDSVQRQFIVSIPTGTPPAAGYPLVFMFHGTSQDGELFYNESQWKEKGETGKFITVFPTALQYCVIEEGRQRTTTKWHNGEVEEMACPGQYLKDDRHFVRAMIDSIGARYPLDLRRVYASGFSNGAGFACKLAVDMSDVFAAVAVSGGALSKSDSTTPKRNIPVWFNLGTLDDRWLDFYSTIGLTEFPFNDSSLAYLRPSLLRLLGTFNLVETYTKAAFGRVLSYTFNTPASSEEATEFRFTLIDNMFHVYPNGNNIPFVAADVFWEFFSRFTLPVKAEPAPPAASTITVYPNPAGDHLVIDGTGDATLTLRNILGQEVFRAHGQKGVPFMLPKLTTGIYAAEILSGSRNVVKTVVIR
ncbi:MAG: T9SS type A sorting domain-containing protein [Ignavibacteria bacterium]|nr:T9SS type A sorting domain-containing protein [Ignavibacteria bacterium]